MVYGKRKCLLWPTLDRSHGAKLDTTGVRGVLGIFLPGGQLSYVRGAAGNHIKATLQAGLADRDLLEEKIAELRSFIPTKAQITSYQTPVRDSGQRTSVLRFRFTSDSLRPIYNLLHPEGEREITRPVLEILGGRGAAWLWADGCRPADDGSAILAHVGTLHDEAALVSGWLELLTGAPSTIATGWSRPRLYFDPEAARQLRSVLLPYAPQSRKGLFLEERP